MKRILFAVTFASAMVLVLPAYAQEKTKTKTKQKADGTVKTKTKTETQASDVTPEEAQKRWMDFATPGEMHQMIAKMDGVWQGETQYWMDPSAPPTTTTMRSVQTSMYDGRYFETNVTGEMMGMKFEGKSILGYDKVKKAFVSSWIDNMGSGIIYMEGNYDADKKILTLTGVQSDPVTGAQSKIREETEFIDENTYILRMFGTGPDGKEMKMMEGKYSRIK